MGESTDIQSVPLERLDERYGELRIARPRQEDAVRESVRRFGQLTPLVVSPRADRLAIVDGFKRLHAAQQLSLEQLTVRSLVLSEQAAVAAVYSLNRHGRGLSDLEEALVVRALCREHGLAQVEVAELLSRHKSWVCRRLLLVERLTDQVQQDVRVGLVSISVARELARLPRGNQDEVAAAVYRHGLTAREATHLTTLFEQTANRSEQEELLAGPREAVDKARGQPPSPPHDPRLGAEANRLRRLVCSSVGVSSRLASELRSTDPSSWAETERSVLTGLLRQASSATALLGESIGTVLDATEGADAS